MDDRRLLKQFIESGSQAAFSQIVERHHKLVYSTCWRELRNTAQAEDATQVVFLVLAEKAKSLSRDVSLAGWLFRTARFAAMAMRSSEARRRAREQKIGSEILKMVQQDSDAWTIIEPWLDESLAQLGEADRVGVLLRFFEDMSFAEIAAMTGQKEDTARIRVSRALDKMHRFLVKNGVLVAQSIFVGLFAANAVKPAAAIPVPVIEPGALSAIAPGHAAALVSASRIHRLTQGVLRTMLIKQVATAAAVVLTGITGIAVPAALHRADAQPSSASSSGAQDSTAASASPSASGALQGPAAATNAAQVFFNALAAGDAKTAVAMTQGHEPGSVVTSPKMAQAIASYDAFITALASGRCTAQIIGAPIMRGRNPHLWFIPYELQSHATIVIDGQQHPPAIQVGKLAIRNDNPRSQWVVDGGL